MKQTVKMILAAVLLVCGVACTQVEIPSYEQQTRFISGVYINSALTLTPGDFCTIQAAGVQAGDQLVFRTADRDRKEVAVASFAQMTDRTATFVVPTGLVRGSYYLYARRGEQEQFLAACSVFIL